MEKNKKGYILLSGGQDSFVCLLWAKENFEVVEAISVSYGQRHVKELKYAAEICSHFGVVHTIYDVGEFIKTIAESSLLNSDDHNSKHKQAEDLPASFVPNRNGLFLTIIANHAFRQNEKHIHLITGTCETDYSGYPDCRDTYIKAKQIELSLGLDRPVTIHTPLMWKNKAETFAMADSAGKLKELNELTLTCYNGVETLNKWGRGCGECPSCGLRKKGFEEFEKSYKR